MLIEIESSITVTHNCLKFLENCLTNSMILTDGFVFVILGVKVLKQEKLEIPSSM